VGACLVFFILDQLCDASVFFALSQKLHLAQSPGEAREIVGIFTVRYPFFMHCITVNYYILYRRRTCVVYDMN
jgi:hypothetical protein